MPKPSPELLATAAHEIGHAVVNSALGLQIEYVRIDGVGKGNCRVANYDYDSYDQVRAFSVGCMAGYLAEVRWCAQHGPGRPDRRSAKGDYAVFEEATRDLRRKHGIRLTRSDAEAEAAVLVKANWRHITDLTPRLAAHGELRGL